MRAGIWLALTALLAVSSLSAQAYRLQFKDPAGAARHYTCRTVQEGTVTFSGLQSPVTATTTFTALEKVTAVGKNAASLAFSVSGGHMSIKISNLPGEEGEQTIDQALPDMYVAFDRTPFGRVSNVKVSGGVADMMGGMLNGLSGQLQVPGQLFQFPDRELKDGDTWSATQKFPLGDKGTLEIRGNYTLVGAQQDDDGKQYVQIDSDLVIIAKGMKVKVPIGEDAMGLTINMSLMGKETTRFDIAEGVVARADMKLNGTTDVVVAGSADPMKMVSTTTVTVVRVK